MPEASRSWEKQKILFRGSMSERSWWDQARLDNLAAESNLKIIGMGKHNLHFAEEAGITKANETHKHKHAQEQAWDFMWKRVAAWYCLSSCEISQDLLPRDTPRSLFQIWLELVSVQQPNNFKVQVWQPEYKLLKVQNSWKNNAFKIGKN